MGVMSGGAVSITAADIDQIVDEVWDELTSGHTTAGTTGLTQRQIRDAAISGAAGSSLMASTAPTAATISDAVWDEANADHVTAGSAGLAQNRIKDVAISSGDAANSISQKLRGMTDNQAVATAGVTRTFDNTEFTMTASQTTDIIPATGESDTGLVWVRVAVATDDFRLSANSGTNYTAVPTVGVMATLGSAGNVCAIIGVGNSTGRYRIVTDNTVGTRTFARAITTEA